MKQTPITVHVGLMKTATTTLQKRVFPHHEGLNYLGGPEFVDDAICSAIAAISKQDRFMYDGDYHRKQASKIISDAVKQDKPILISAESLSTPTVDRLTKAERIVELFGEVRFLLCLRRPEDLMTSLYSESIKLLNPKSGHLPDLDSWLDREWSDQRATRHTRILDFSALIRCYQNLVGKENVSVVLFEDLCNKPTDYAHQLSDFIGTSSQRTLELLQAPKENRSVTELDYKLFKLSSLLGFRVGNEKLMKFIPRPVKEIIKNSMSGTKKFSMSDEWRERIRVYSREANEDLGKLIGSGPERYDYF